MKIQENKELFEKLESLSPRDDKIVKSELLRYFIGQKSSKYSTIALVRRHLNDKKQRQLLNFIKVINAPAYGSAPNPNPQTRADTQYNGAYEE